MWGPPSLGLYLSGIPTLDHLLHPATHPLSEAIQWCGYSDAKKHIFSDPFNWKFALGLST